MTTIAVCEIFCQCYNIHEYFLCRFYQYFFEKKTLKHNRYIQFQVVRCGYCCVFTFFNTFSQKDLHKMKDNATGLVKFYISIQTELSIILNNGISEYRQLWKDEKDSYINWRLDMLFPFKVYNKWFFCFSS